MRRRENIERVVHVTKNMVRILAPNEVVVCAFRLSKLHELVAELEPMVLFESGSSFSWPTP